VVERTLLIGLISILVLLNGNIILNNTKAQLDPGNIPPIVRKALEKHLNNLENMSSTLADLQKRLESDKIMILEILNNRSLEMSLNYTS